MATTTIRLEEALKARVAAAAEIEGMTAHAYILDAIAQTVERTELAEESRQIAEQRWAKMQRDGKTVGWEQAKAYLEGRAAGRSARKPTARKPRA